MTAVELAGLFGLILAGLSGAVSLYAAIRLRRIGRKVWHEAAVGGLLLIGVALTSGFGLTGTLSERITLFVLQPISYALWTIIAMWALREWAEWRDFYEQVKAEATED